MKQSGLLLRQRKINQAYMDTTERVMKQFMVDTLQMTLHDMGWGYERILRLTEAWGKKYSAYYKALGTSTEADYLRFCMDRELKDLLKDKQELEPFEARYPDIKRITYGGGESL